MIPPLPNSLSLADRTLTVSSTAASTVSRFACIVRPPVDCGLTRGYRTGAMRLGDSLGRPALLSLFGDGYTPEGKPVPPSGAKNGVRMRLQVISSQQLVHAGGELGRLPDVHTEAVSRNHWGHVTAGRTFPDLLAHRLQQPQGLLFHVRPHIRVTTSHVNSIGDSPWGSGLEPSRRNQGNSIGVSLRSACVLANIYAAPLDVVLTSMHRTGGRASSAVRRARTIQDRESELPRIPVPRTWVNKPVYTSKHPVATVSSHKYHPFRGCIDAHNFLPCPCGRRCYRPLCEDGSCAYEAREQNSSQPPPPSGAIHDARRRVRGRSCGHCRGIGQGDRLDRNLLYPRGDDTRRGNRRLGALGVGTQEAPHPSLSGLVAIGRSANGPIDDELRRIPLPRSWVNRAAAPSQPATHQQPQSHDQGQHHRRAQHGQNGNRHAGYLRGS